MPLKTLVKVSKISNLSDARYCSGMGVEMLGFRVIAGNEEYMPAERFQDIRGWISGPKVIAELYGLSHADEIAFVLKTYAPDYFELTYAEYMTFKDALSLPCIVYISTGTTNTESLNNDRNILFILVDESTRCSEITTTYPLMIKISSIENLNQKSAEGCFKGFVLEGSKESRPGVTNYEQLGEILEALDVE